jgi:hypothetical protein
LGGVRAGGDRGVDGDRGGGDDRGGAGRCVGRGYGLLWIVLLSVLIKGIFVTYLLGRYTAVSGELIGHRLVHFPGPCGWLLITIIILELVAAPPVWAVIARPCGNLLHHLGHEFLSDRISTRVRSQIIASCFVALALGVSLRMSFNRLEKQQLLICFVLVTGTVIGTIMVRPDLKDALEGMLRFGHLPQLPEKVLAEQGNKALVLVTMFGYVGGTVMGYIVYANWVSLRRWGMTGHAEIEWIRVHAATRERIDYLPDDPAAAKQVNKLIAPLRWDSAMGALVLLIVTATFMMAGAAGLHPLVEQGEDASVFKGWSLLTDQAFIWRNIHPKLTWVYYVCVIAALWGTLQAFPEVYSRVTHEFCDAIAPGRTWRDRHVSSCDLRLLAGHDGVVVVDRLSVQHADGIRCVFIDEPGGGVDDVCGIVLERKTGGGLSNAPHDVCRRRDLGDHSGDCLRASAHGD